MSTNDAPAQASVEAEDAERFIAAFQPKTPRDAMAITLFKAWVKADPRNIVSQYPTSYLANFVDMADAALAALSPPPTVGAEDEAARAWMLDLANRLRRVPCEHIDGADIDRLVEIARGHPAPAADGQRVKDGRPEGWTEALAISFMAANGHNPEMGMFAKSFNEGAWRKIKDEWPEFVEFVSVHIRACLATDKEGA